jgi:hypothetical protein
MIALKSGASLQEYRKQKIRMNPSAEHRPLQYYMELDIKPRARPAISPEATSLVALSKWRKEKLDHFLVV